MAPKTSLQLLTCRQSDDCPICASEISNLVSDQFAGKKHEPGSSLKMAYTSNNQPHQAANGVSSVLTLFRFDSPLKLMADFNRSVAQMPGAID